MTFRYLCFSRDGALVEHHGAVAEAAEGLPGGLQDLGDPVRGDQTLRGLNHLRLLLHHLLDGLVVLGLYRLLLLDHLLLLAAQVHLTDILKRLIKFDFTLTKGHF